TAADVYLYLTEPACSVEGAPNITASDTSYSWLSAAASDFNSAEHVPSAWEIAVENDAVGGASTSSFGVSGETVGTNAWASGSSQAGKMRGALYARYDSWNVVSMTGGGIDAGLHSVLSSWYHDNWTGTVTPWGVTSASNCPDSNTIYSNLTTGSPT